MYLAPHPGSRYPPQTQKRVPFSTAHPGAPTKHAHNNNNNNTSTAACYCLPHYLHIKRRHPCIREATELHPSRELVYHHLSPPRSAVREVRVALPDDLQGRLRRGQGASRARLRAPPFARAKEARKEGSEGKGREGTTPKRTFAGVYSACCLVKYRVGNPFGIYRTVRLRMSRSNPNIQHPLRACMCVLVFRFLKHKEAHDDVTGSRKHATLSIDTHTHLIVSSHIFFAATALPPQAFRYLQQKATKTGQNG